MRISESDKRFIMWALGIWCFILLIILSGCGLVEKKHETPPMLMRPMDKQACEGYLTPEDALMLMRLHNYGSCVDEFELDNQLKDFKI